MALQNELSPRQLYPIHCPFSLRKEILHFTGIEIKSLSAQMAFLEPPVLWFRLFIH